MATGVPGFFGLKAESNFPPVISSVTLTELSPGNGELFGNQWFSVDVVMTNEGKPVAGKALKGYIDGTFNEPVLTDYISSVNETISQSGSTFYAVDASQAKFNGGVSSPTTSNFVSVAIFEERYLSGRSTLTRDHFLAVTDDNKLAYSPNGVQWEVRAAGITNAVFRKVQPLFTVGSSSPTGSPIFVACGQISGGDYFLATCDDNATFVVDKTLTEEVLFLTGNWAGTTTELYYRASPRDNWQLIDSGNGPYQYQFGVPGGGYNQYVRNGNFVVKRAGRIYTGLTGLIGGFDDRYFLSRSIGGSADAIAGPGGAIIMSTSNVNNPLETYDYRYDNTAITGATQYYKTPDPEDNPYWNVIAAYATVSGGKIKINLDNSATLNYARDVAYSDTKKLGVFVGDGGQIIYAVHESLAVDFSSDLNFSLIDKYDALSLVIGNTEYPQYSYFVLNKSSTSMTLLGDSGYVSPGRRFRGGSVTTGAARRYLQMINYAGAYNSVEGLIDSDPGFTDQQTTGNEIQDIRFPATYEDQDGFINRFEDVVDSGATLTIELKAFNASGSDTDSDTVTPS